MVSCRAHTALGADATEVRLSKLKLAGFKTFVDPTTVHASSRLVGIVGPNGCGKSNLIDAVRWVLGEMRASALRGDSMQDVIFNGSLTRKAVSRASVELVFDNSEGRAGGHWARYAEISVKRVLDRSGESTYLINNTPVRRKDVIDVFLGTGLGPKAYAIIEQGMISRIIESRPEEVRGFLEEAAGVTKYRERRRETEGRLRDARDNLIRLDDIRGELAERIEHLEDQARVAARHRELSAAREQAQHLLWLLKYEQARHQATALEATLADTSRQLDHESERLHALERRVENARDTHARLTEATQEGQSALYVASAEVTRLDSERRHIEQTRATALQRLAEIDDERTQWLERQSTLQHERERWQTLEEHTALRMEHAEARHALLADSLPDLDGARDDAAQGVAQARQELGLAEQQRRVAETECQHADRALEQLATRRTRIHDARAAITLSDELALARVEARVEELETRLTGAEAELAHEQQTLADAEHSLHDAAAREREQQHALTSLQAHHQALVDLQTRSHRPGELGDWLREQGCEALPALWAELEVAAGWEQAVEAVLQERLRALQTRDTALLARSLATPPPEPLAFVFPVAEARDLPSHVAPPGCVALHKHVQCKNPTLAPAVASWLGMAFAVDTLEPWLERHAELNTATWLVDRAGRLLGRYGLIHHVADARTQGLLERQREIDALAEREVMLAHNADDAGQVLENARRHVAERREQLAGLRSRIQELQQDVHREELVRLEMRRDAQRAQEQHAALTHELEELDALEEAERERHAEAQQLQAQMEERVAVLRERLEAAQETLDEHEARSREVRAHESTARHELQEARFAVRECAGKQTDIAHHLDLATEQLERIKHDEDKQRAGLEANVLERSEAALEAALSKRAECEHTLAQQRNAQEEAAAHLRDYETQRLQAEQALGPLRTRTGELRLSLQAAQLEAEQFGERLAEAQADVDILRPLLENEAPDAAQLQRTIERSSRALQGLGAVNLAALDELRAASERKDYLDAQNADLVEAINTLEDAIRRIDRETREQLQHTYDSVNAHFGTLFPRLFGGGRATLEMTGEEILDAGIQIIAQPPGKKNSSIHLLSGGEKALTAIALVFSMFQLNPAPFCMLDEVDAPLDDANTERYCRMVERMSHDTQFIFISHNKLTMEIAQQLIGVTMQEQGVSRIVDVDIEKALALAETTPA